MKFKLLSYILVTVIMVLLSMWGISFLLTIVNMRNDIAVGFGLLGIVAVIFLAVNFFIWLWVDYFDLNDDDKTV